MRIFPSSQRTTSKSFIKFPDVFTFQCPLNTPNSVNVLNEAEWGSGGEIKQQCTFVGLPAAAWFQVSFIFRGGPHH